MIKAPIYSLMLENQSLRILPHAGSQTRLDAQIVKRPACRDERMGRDAEQFTALNVGYCVHD